MAKPSTNTKKDKSKDSFQISGAWYNEDKAGNAYFVAPLTPQQVVDFREELEKYEAVGCKIVSFENSYRTEEKHPHYKHYLYPKKTDKE